MLLIFPSEGRASTRSRTPTCEEAAKDQGSLKKVPPEPLTLTLLALTMKPLTLTASQERPRLPFQR
jgi:hypothetical protein